MAINQIFTKFKSSFDVFGSTFKTKHRNLAILAIFGYHFWQLKSSKITSFINFELHFMMKFRKKKKLVIG